MKRRHPRNTTQLPVIETEPQRSRVLILLAITAAAFLVAFGVTKWSKNRQPANGPVGMVWIPGGEFTMGTDSTFQTWPDEHPAHRVRVNPFWMDATEVTNAEFKKFVDATGYVTLAEKAPTVEEIMKQSPPGTKPPDPKDLVPGSLVFTQPDQPVEVMGPYAYSQWWRWTPGANWQHPEGPNSNLDGRENHPVVQVAWDDAAAYAKWAGKRLPTEAEWEFAARGGLDNKPFGWGNQPPDDKHIFANIWQGRFPDVNTKADGFVRTAPVKSFKPNGFGLYDMAGNVWEWCSDWYDHDLYGERAGKGVIDNPAGPDRSNNLTNPLSPQRVQKGGSFLCCDQYCTRYRPSARQGGAVDTGMSHAGFRCVKSP